MNAATATDVAKSLHIAWMNDWPRITMIRSKAAEIVGDDDDKNPCPDILSKPSNTSDKSCENWFHYRNNASESIYMLYISIPNHQICIHSSGTQIHHVKSWVQSILQNHPKITATDISSQRIMIRHSIPRCTKHEHTSLKLCIQYHNQPITNDEVRVWIWTINHAHTPQPTVDPLFFISLEPICTAQRWHHVSYHQRDRKTS